MFCLMEEKRMSDEVVESTNVESVADDELESVADEGEGGSGQDGGEDSSTVSSEEESGGGEQQKAESFELKASEDFPVPEENLKSFAEAAMKVGMTKEQAEAMLGWHREWHQHITKQQSIAESQLIAGWQREILDDPEFGGQNYKATIADGRRALREFDPDGSLRRVLKEMRADFHPVVVRAIARVGRSMREHNIVGASNGGGNRERVPLEERMWPDMK